MKIGIYGGSFNPVHTQHINLATNAVSELDLDLLYFVPAHAAPHKPGEVPLDGAERFNMLVAATENIPHLKVSDYELLAGGKSYTYITIEHFKNTYPNAELYFLVGTDMLENFPKWKNPRRILDCANLFVTGRMGEDIESAKTAFYNTFPDYKEKLIISELSCENVSSTDIRNRLLLGLSVSGLVPDAVEDYIRKKGLYKGDKVAAFVRKSLPIKRLTHVLGVMNLAKTYAKRLFEDENKALLAAMLHDVAKYLKPEDYPGFFIDSSVPSPVVHQFLGAYISENILGVTDADVINAVRYHTTGRPAMTNLEKIVFIADLLEAGRTYEEVNMLRAAVDADFEKGFRLCVERLMYFLSQKEEPIYGLTKECYNYYVK